MKSIKKHHFIGLTPLFSCYRRHTAHYPTQEGQCHDKSRSTSKTSFNRTDPLMRMTEKSKHQLSYGDAFRIIQELESHAEHASHVREELPAIISHWLFSPHESPISLGDKFLSKWTQFLQIKGFSTDFDLSELPFPPPLETKFSFIDLFAGIGGFRIAMQNLCGKCVFTSEWDLYAQKTYAANYGEIPFGDITKINESDIPSHDILCGGFPCQAFSIAGRKWGFEDSRGTMFFEIARILKKREPSAFLLENVKGLMSHQRGRTIAHILGVLREDLGYFVPDPQVIRAEDFGVPQKRGRVFIVGFHPRTRVDFFEYPRPLAKKSQLSDIKESGLVSAKYYVSTNYLKSMREHRKRHEEMGNGFGYEIIPDNGIANTIVIGGMGSERNLVIDHSLKDFTPVTHIQGEVNREGIRRMTPREWARLQGFPEEFVIPKSDAQAYKQFGNSVAIPAIRATARKILEALTCPPKGSQNQLRLF